MWPSENEHKSAEISVSSFGVAEPQLVKVTPPKPDEVPGEPTVGAAVADHDMYCGLLGMYPGCLQSWRTPRCYLFFICILGMTQGFVVNGLVSVVTPTIEKRFQLLGVEAGVIQSMFNVASCIMVTPVSYHGGVGHKPVIMGIGALVMAAGSMVFCSPHFLAPQYISFEAGGSDVCPEQGPGKCAGASSSHSISNYKYFFMVGHALHGIGSSPFFTLGVAYLDQNTPTDQASLYMGIFYATSVLGPAMGFLLGAFFLSKYTDITLDSSQLGISSTSNTWVGAWWLGFLGASIAAFFTAFPMASFPRFLPTAQQRAKDLSDLQKKKATATQIAEAPKNPEPALPTPDGQVYPKPDAEPASGARAGKGPRRSSKVKASRDEQAAPVSQTAGAVSPDQSQRSLLNHVKRLMLNPTFVFLTLSAAAETMIASGLTGFATKIFIAMFGISSTRASSLLGMVAVPSACGGTLLGGYVITQLKVSSATIVRYCAILALVPWFTLFVFLKTCPSKYSVLVNLTTADDQKLTFRDLERTCNIRCNCSGAVYDPVCGTDNLTYYSPCLAGCADVRRVKKTKDTATPGVTEAAGEQGADKDRTGFQDGLAKGDGGDEGDGGNDGDRDNDGDRGNDGDGGDNK